MGNSAPAGEEHPVNELRLPPFTPWSPKLWLTRVEATFTLHNVQDDAKFRHVIDFLATQYRDELSDFIVNQNPPVTENYEELKQAIVQRFPSEYMAHQLLGQQDIGLPSQLLRRMQNEAREVPLRVIRILWHHRLPRNIQSILEVLPETISLDDAAAVADKAFEATSIPVDFRELLQAMCTLQREIENLKQEMSRSRSQQLNAPKELNQACNICWYHRKYGREARQCFQPCSYHNNEN